MEERWSEYRAGQTEKEETSKGETERPVYTYTTWQGGVREGERGGHESRRNAEREQDGTFLFHRTVETRACHGGRVGGEVAVARARARGQDEKRG